MQTCRNTSEGYLYFRARLLHYCTGTGSIPHGRDPSIVSPSWCVHREGSSQTRYRIEVHAAEGPRCALLIEHLSGLWINRHGMALYEEDAGESDSADDDELGSARPAASHTFTSHPLCNRRFCLRTPLAAAVAMSRLRATPIIPHPLSLHTRHLARPAHAHASVSGGGGGPRRHRAPCSSAETGLRLY